jgi:hypothetical protein
MASVQIPNLPAVIGLDGSELFEGVQAGTSVKISLAQMIAAARITTPITFPLSVSVGGTGITSFAVGDIIYASATETLSKLPAAATGNALLSGTTPSYGKIGLTTHVSGVLPVANGGTNQSGALTQYGVIYGNTTTSMASSAAGTTTTVLHGNAAGAPTWSAVSLTADVSGALPVTNGGTNITSYTIGDLVYASASGVLSKLADVATGNALISGGVGVAPSYGKIGLTTHVSGTLPLANGGTNATTGAGAFANMMGFTTTATAGATTTLTNASTQYQLFTGATFQTVALPVTSTLTTGWTFHIVNNSTGDLTVVASSGTQVCTVIPNTTAMITCISTAVTTPAAWEFGFTDFGSVSGTGAVVLATGPTITNGVYSGTVGASSPSTGAFTTVTASTSVLSSGTGGIGYSTGSGVAVTQLTSRTTPAPTTGAKTSGAVTLFTTTAVVGTYFSFTVPNTGIAATDTVVLSVRGATNTYVAFVSAITAATSFQVTMASVVGIASDTPIVNFTIIKGVSA